MPKTVRILLVDDQPYVRQGLRMALALESDFMIVGEGNDGAEALSLVAALQPNLIVMDVAMPVLDGITATACLRAANAPCVVLLLSLHDEPHLRAQAQAAGAIAFVSKHESLTVLIAAIRQAIEHGWGG